MKSDDMEFHGSYEYVIIGAGPAGLQAGYFMRKAGRNYVIVEAGDSPGTFFQTFPRHRKLISINKVYTGYQDPEISLRFDWNSLLGDSEDLLFKKYSRDYFPDANVMVDYLRDYANYYELNIRYKFRVVNVEKEEDGIFRLSDSSANCFRANRLIVATGMTQPYMPPIPGIELAESYVNMSTDQEDFTDQRVLIIGKGNSGFETADRLIPVTALIHVASPNPVTMAWKTHHVGDLRAVNNNFLDTYQLKSQNAVLDCTIKRIERRDGKFFVSLIYTHANDEAENLVYDRVINCTGFRFDAGIFGKSCRPLRTINERFPALTSAWESVNVPGLIFAGTLMQMRDFKKYNSGFIHGFRYNIRSLHRMLEQKYHGQSWPSRRIEPTPEGLTDAVIGRVNRSSALWQQFSVLADVIIVSNDGQEGRYYEELPIEYVHDSEFGRNANFYMISLEFGQRCDEDPFHVVRYPDPARAADSFFLHPVVRHFSGPHLAAEHHIMEDLSGEWKRKDAHIEPLSDFFASQEAEVSQRRIS